MLLLLMFLTPVFYPAQLLIDRAAFWYWFNPLSQLLEAYRQVILVGEFKLLTWEILAAWALVSFAAGLMLFHRQQRLFPDLV